MRLPLVVSVLASILACGGGGDATSTASTEGAAAAPSAPAPAPAKLTIPVFAPVVGEGYRVTSDMAMDITGAESPTVRVQVDEHLEGEVIVRTITNGRIDSVTVKVTAGKSTTTTPEGTQEALPDSVGKEYFVTHVVGGENRVERTDGKVLRGEEGDAPRRLGGELFSDRATPISAGLGDSIDATQLLGAPDEGTTMSGRMTLGVASPTCSAPFTGSVAGTSIEGGTTMAMSMTGDVCVDPTTGLVTKSELQGNIDGGIKGTMRMSSTAKKL